MILTPDAAADKIGLTRVRDRLVELTQSEPTARRIRRLETSSDLQKIGRQLEIAGELQGCLEFDDAIPFSAVVDVAPILDKARPEGAALTTEQILDVFGAERSARLVHLYLRARLEKYPMVADNWSGLIPNSGFEEAVEKIYEADGRVKDDASPTLRRIRRELQNSHQNLRNKIASSLSRAAADGIAADEQPTIRSGRMVIPVLSSAKNRIDGFVHDVSATGQTVYVEPRDCLELNNQIRELEAAERREIDELRKYLTELIRRGSGAIATNGELLIQFDLALTVARFANEIHGKVPLLNADGRIRVVSGRNPELLLLYRSQKRENEVVPLHLELGASFNTLIISGPNAGGKSVAMKSIGLMTAMLGLGIPVPAGPESEFCLFTKVMVDIGDAQSMDDDLSTYSSHLANLKAMLREADASTLILIDEIGTGTDPDEGSALARSVLEWLTERGARTIVTTHQGSLKVFANDTENVANGAMSFNMETLAPTFEFRLHTPGASYASEIAARVGIPSQIIARAKELVGNERVQMESLITSLEGSNEELESRLEETEAVLKKANDDRQQLEARLTALQAGRDDIRRKAVEEAEAIIKNANRVVEGVVREIRESAADSVRTKIARERLVDAKRQLSEKSGRLKRRSDHRSAAEADSTMKETGGALKSTGAEKQTVQNKSRGDVSGASSYSDLRRGRSKGPLVPLKEGDRVKLDVGDAIGEVLSIKGDEVVVAFDSLQTRVRAKRVTKVGEASEQSVSVRQSAGMELPSTEISQAIDVRGLRVDEAVSRVSTYVDAASAAMLKQVEILHGKGTGALREAISEYLNGMESVSKIEEAPWNEGGAGVTIVFLNS